MPWFASLSLPLLMLLFASAAVAVWISGGLLARLVNALTIKTGIGQAFMGMLLLGGITSLPEVAAVTTSASMGNAPLAVNNLLGTASFNVLLLALADIVYGRGALTAVAAKPAILMQGVLVILLMTVVAFVATVGDVPLLAFGAGSLFLLGGSILALYLSSDYDNRHVWEVVDADKPSAPPQIPERADASLQSIIVRIGGCAIVILAAGFVLASSADQVAERTGISSGMIGFLLVGAATSLPEISTITAAIRLKKYQMAMGDVFGTNIFNVSLIFVADLAYSGPPVLQASGAFEVGAALLAIAMTTVFIIGLLQRRSRTIFRMGYDSLVAIFTFAAGVAVLASLA